MVKQSYNEFKVMQRNKLLKLIGFFIVFLFTAQAGFAANVTLQAAQIFQTGLKTHLVFNFNKKVRFVLFTLNNPDRVVIDFHDASVKTNLRQLSLRNTPIKDIREAPFNPTTWRVVLDMKTRVKISKATLKSGRLLEIDLVQAQKTKIASNKPSHTKTTIVSNTAPAQIITANKVLKANLGRNIIVVVDPGHGGKDPGATGPMGIHEKNVVLAMGKDIRRDVDAIPGMTAKMTRYGDYFITLRDRLNIARRDHADFFVAIHADAFIERDAVGASVFALSQRGATSEAARWLAQKENYSELGGVDLADKSRVLRSVLIDLSQTATITQSLDVGKMVAHSIAKITPMHSQQVEQARFVVLKSPDIPSLLVETGFITNPKEEKLLSSPWYQQKIAAAITAGVKAYFWKFPPPDTLFALEKDAKKYVVKPGNTLASIANHYQVTKTVLIRMNNLKGHAVHSGQVLLVPELTPGQ